ncbi:hypothetical protein ACEWY4_017352 [Coilia grayii]|uniref:Pyrin domain-containing protein n=1 Tax=Coilia grayii TaxID=363190 RepID=A0ABD1JGM5_9TELE
MAECKQVMYDILDGLEPTAFKRFKSLLSEGVEDYDPIPKGHVAQADATAVADKMVEVYDYEDAVKVSIAILRMLPRNDLANRLEEALQDD